MQSRAANPDPAFGEPIVPDILTLALNPAVDVSTDAELVRPTLKIRTHHQTHHPGGGGINVARVVVELGGSAEVVYLSGGASGALLDDCMQQIGVTAHVVHIEQPTRIAYTVHELKTGFEYRFVPEGPEVNDATLHNVLDLVERFSGKYVVASGSLPMGLPEDTYLQIANIAARKGQRFVLDTSGAALRVTLAEAPVYLVKPSLGELGKLVGHRLDEDGTREAALEIVNRGNVDNVAVSMGPQGALLATRDGVLRLPARHVAVRSAVGAGDSFLGAMVHTLDTGGSIDAAFRVGMAAGAAAVMTAGTELCRREDVEAFCESGLVG